MNTQTETHSVAESLVHVEVGEYLISASMVGSRFIAHAVRDSWSWTISYRVKPRWRLRQERYDTTAAAAQAVRELALTRIFRSTT